MDIKEIVLREILNQREGFIVNYDEPQECALDTIDSFKEVFTRLFDLHNEHGTEFRYYDREVSLVKIVLKEISIMVDLFPMKGIDDPRIRKYYRDMINILFQTVNNLN